MTHSSQLQEVLLLSVIGSSHLIRMEADTTRYVKTAFVTLSFTSFGLASGIIGPALLDLGVLTHSSIDTVSYIFPVRCFGSIIGCLIMGFLYPRINFHLFYSLVSIAFGFVHFVIPLSSSFHDLLINFVCCGIISGFINTSVNTYLIELWGKESQPFIQASQFTFGVGALSGPLIVRPFLLDPSHRQDHLRIQYAFWITGVVCAVPAVYHLLVYLFCKNDKPVLKKVADEIEKEFLIITEDDFIVIEDEQGTKYSSGYKLLAIILMMLFMLANVGLELTYGQYLTTYAVKSDLKLTKATGAEITSLYWTFFTFFRLTTAFYIKYLGCERNILMNLVIILGANVILVPFASRNQACLWIGSAVMGIGCSSIWGCAFGFLEQYFTITSRIASLIVISTNIGSAIFPIVISHFIDDFPNIFLVVTLFCSLSAFALFVSVVIVCRCKLSLVNVK